MSALPDSLKPSLPFFVPEQSHGYVSAQHRHSALPCLRLVLSSRVEEIQKSLISLTAACEGLA
jgi:hypothetical protein